MIKQIEMLNDWIFYDNLTDTYSYGETLSEGVSVHLPHTNEELPYSYFDEKRFQKVTGYKKIFKTPQCHGNQVVKVRFEGVMTYAKVYLNDAYLGEHKGGYTPFEFVVTELLKDGDEDNTLFIIVDSRERDDIPPFGGQIDYLTYGGIYREVTLDIYQETHIENVKIETPDVLAELKKVDAKIWLNEPSEEKEVCVALKLMDSERNLIGMKETTATVVSGTNLVELSLVDLEGIELWDVDSPVLYEVKCSVLALDSALNDEVVDTYHHRIGFRAAEFRNDGFYLNGKPFKIMGLNRHQAWPYVGYAMPKRAQIKDADILKNELSLNLVRTSHYPQSKHFLRRCDEIGLLVFEEIPGWQHIGSEEWKQVAVQNVAEMIERDWNHPSVILWGVRINESADDDTFYTETNRVAHALDMTRQTGGVRYIENSSFFEDVYTMNDFVLDGGDTALREPKKVTGLDRDVPYLVTEYNGHMYPTKKTDSEERFMEHVIRHLRVLDAAYANPKISGAIGWCAFDYNTHKDFGSGDRICHHGVMDMFRLPKKAAYVYKSQLSPEVEVVLEPVTVWARGERSIGGVLPLTVLTNCDAIELVFGDSEPIPVHHRSDAYSHLPYPPFVIDETVIPPNKIGEWGMLWQDGIIRGYVDGKLVAEKTFAKDPLPHELIVTVDDTELTAGQKDATRAVVRLVDQHGNDLPYSNAIVKIDIAGPARIQGPSEMALLAGSIGFWIESDGASGDVEVRVKCDGFGCELNIVVQ